MQRATIFFISLFFAACSLAQTTIELEPVQDNTLFEEDGALSNGRGTGLFVGITNGNVERRTLLQFDVSSIPPDANITNVELELSVTMSRGGVNASLYRLTSSWGEGSSNSSSGGGGGGAPAETDDATWTDRFFPGVFWQNNGGDFASTPSASATIGTSSAFFGSTGELVTDVQQWVVDPASNFGWIMITDSGRGMARRFGSRESSVPPRLFVTFESDGGGSLPIDPLRLSGVLFDPDFPGDGFYLVGDQQNISIAFFGYTVTERLLWLVGTQATSALAPALNEPLEFTLLEGGEFGSFLFPQDPGIDALPEWGTLRLILNTCTTGVAELDGRDGQKTMNLVSLVGNTDCLLPVQENREDED